jgi:hypothetical protein
MRSWRGYDGKFAGAGCCLTWDTFLTVSAGFASVRDPTHNDTQGTRDVAGRAPKTRYSSAPRTCSQESPISKGVAASEASKPVGASGTAANVA